MADPRRTRAWRKLRDQVVREEPICRLQLPCCTVVSTTADHIITVRDRPDLAMVRANLRGACQPCNLSRNSRPLVTADDDDVPDALGFFR